MGVLWCAGRVFRGSAVVGSRRVSLLCRVPDSRALLLAAWTLQCAAKPYWWHGGQPAQATTYRVNVRIKGPTCAGCVHRNRSGPDGSQASRRSPCLLGYDGGGPRRNQPLVARGDRAVGVEKSRYQHHVEFNNPGCERLRCPCPGLVKMSGRERGTLSAVD